MARDMYTEGYEAGYSDRRWGYAYAPGAGSPDYENGYADGYDDAYLDGEDG
jgi:hypothetical protein